jgi:hypothetical protein
MAELTGSHASYVLEKGQCDQLTQAGIFERVVDAERNWNTKRARKQGEGGVETI